MRMFGLALTLIAASGPAAVAATQVSVVLEDQSTRVGIQGMRMEATPDTVKAGRVELTVKNASQAVVHELLLVKAPAGGKPPYDDRAQRIVENRLVKLIDIDDIPPGRSVRKVVTLPPGTYEMLCNQPGHYAQGMHTAFSVTP